MLSSRVQFVPYLAVFLQNAQNCMDKKLEKKCREQAVELGNTAVGWRFLRSPHHAAPKPLGLFDKNLVKGGELLTLSAYGKVQGIGKIQALPGEVNGVGDRFRALDFYILKAEGFAKGIQDGRQGETIRVAQNPFGFEDNGGGDKDVVFGEQGDNLLELGLVVAGEKADKDIGINRDQGMSP